MGKNNKIEEMTIDVEFIRDNTESHLVMFAGEPFWFAKSDVTLNESKDQLTINAKTFKRKYEGL